MGTTPSTARPTHTTTSTTQGSTMSSTSQTTASTTVVGECGVDTPCSGAGVVCSVPGYHNCDYCDHSDFTCRPVCEPEDRGDQHHHHHLTLRGMLQGCEGGRLAAPPAWGLWRGVPHQRAGQPGAERLHLRQHCCV